MDIKPEANPEDLIHYPPDGRIVFLPTPDHNWQSNFRFI